MKWEEEREHGGERMGRGEEKGEGRKGPIEDWLTPPHVQNPENTLPCTSLSRET